MRSYYIFSASLCILTDFDETDRAFVVSILIEVAVSLVDRIYLLKMIYILQIFIKIGKLSDKIKMVTSSHGKGSHQKKTGKKVHNSCELWGGVSKFWCVNFKKVLFLELIFPKTC